MANTTNLNLVKPGLDDDALITDINGNMDLIDAFAGTTNQAIATFSSKIGENLQRYDLGNIQAGYTGTITTIKNCYLIVYAMASRTTSSAFWFARISSSNSWVKQFDSDGTLVATAGSNTLAIKNPTGFDTSIVAYNVSSVDVSTLTMTVSQN